MRIRHLAVLGVVASIAALGAAPSASGQFFPSDCRVSGGGQLLGENGERATFGGSAEREGPTAARGHEVYVDHGLVTELRFRSLTVAAMTCNLDARTAEITGQGVVDANGVQEIVQYKIEVFAPNNRTGSRDFYRITLSNGYDSGLRPVIGNIVIRET